MKKILILGIVGITIKIFADSPWGRDIQLKVRQRLRKIKEGYREGFDNIIHKIENTAEQVDDRLQKSVE